MTQPYTPKLKPCEECGAEASISYMARRFYAVCSDSQCNSQIFVQGKSFIEAVKAWNAAIDSYKSSRFLP